METSNTQTGTFAIVAPGHHHAGQFRQLLATAITMRIQQLKVTGGPSVADAQDVPFYQFLGSAGEDGPTIRQTAEALAVLSFIPGGIYVLGMYCQASANPPVSLYRHLA